MNDMVLQAENALIWRASVNADQAETTRLQSLLGLSVPELRSRATTFGLISSPEKEADACLLRLSQAGTLRAQLASAQLLGKVVVSSRAYKGHRENLGVRSNTPKKASSRSLLDADRKPPTSTPLPKAAHRRAPKATRDRALSSYLEYIQAQAGAPVLDDGGVLMVEPSHRWIERRRPELPNWGWVNAFLAQCSKGGCAGTHAVSTRRLVRWLDQVTAWNDRNSRRPPRAVSNVGKCDDCWRQSQESKEARYAGTSNETLSVVMRATKKPQHQAALLLEALR